MTSKLAKAFAAASMFAMAACTQSVPEGEPGHYPRRLTPGEIEMAQQFFGNEIDYRRVRVSSHRGLRSMTLGSRLHMGSISYAEDYSRHPNREAKKLFIHEMGHVWQEHRGVNLVDSAVRLFFRHGGDYNQSYIYNLRDVEDFRALSIEQQASLIEDYAGNVFGLNGLNSRFVCTQIRRQEEILKPVLPHLQTPGLCR